MRNKTSIQNNTGCSIFHGSERREEHAERRQRCMQRNATGRGSEEKKQVMELSHLQVTCLPVAGHLVGMIDKRALFLTARFACNLLSRPKNSECTAVIRPVPTGSLACACDIHLPGDLCYIYSARSRQVIRVQVDLVLAFIPSWFRSFLIGRGASPLPFCVSLVKLC